MNLLSKKVLLVSLTTALAGSSQSAVADAFAQASIDWDNLSVQIFDLSGGSNAPILNWTYRRGEAASNATSFDPYDYTSRTKAAYNFTNTLDADSSTDFAQSQSIRNSSVLEAYAATQTSTSTDAWWSSGSNYAYANVLNEGNFTLTGHGLALIKLEWSIFGNSDSAVDWSEQANSGINISGSYSDGLGSTTSSFSEASQFAAWYANNAYSQEGVFTMAIFGDGIHTINGWLKAQAWANSTSTAFASATPAAVPIPAAIWMFASGLLGVIGVSRRKATV